MTEDVPISKTRRKQEMHALRDLGQELTQLSTDQLRELDLPEALREAVLEAKRIKSFGAVRRQMQYIGKLMRSVDAEPIRDKLDAWQGNSVRHTAWLHSLERWRARLLENEEALGEMAAACPDADLPRLRTLTRNARREQAAGRPPKAFRALFQELRTLIPEPGASDAPESSGSDRH